MKHSTWDYLFYLFNSGHHFFSKTLLIIGRTPFRWPAIDIKCAHNIWPPGTRSLPPRDLKKLPGGDLKRLPKDLKSLPKDLKTLPKDLKNLHKDLKSLPKGLKSLPGDLKTCRLSSGWSSQQKTRRQVSGSLGRLFRSPHGRFSVP